MRRLLLTLVLAVAGLTALAPPAHAGTLVPVVPPTISGTAEYAAHPDRRPRASGRRRRRRYAYQWLRDGQPIGQATARDVPARPRRPRPHAGGDCGRNRRGRRHRGGDLGADRAGAAKATLKAKGGQVIKGVARFTHTLDAHPGRYSETPSKVTFQWLRGKQPIAGATDKRYAIQARRRRRPAAGAADRAGAGLPAAHGHVTEPTPKVRHRVDVRRTVRYHVETRGKITTSLKEFKAQAQQTYEDARGWRAAGIRFVPVARGGAFTLVLSQASLVPSFSSQCSSMWSCRVGRFVIINQDRWKNASPAWNAAHLALRDYRHMVVNHETGHWLGLHHATCPGKGRLAPVMQQQSKGLQGCRFNPFPTIHELNSRTPRGRAMAYLMARSYSPDVE